MKIARIIKSNSHVDYIGRVLDKLETAEPPSSEHFQFGQFVAIPTEATTMVGLIYNSQLINPEFGRLGPRLSSSAEMNGLTEQRLNACRIPTRNLSSPRRPLKSPNPLSTLAINLFKTWHSYPLPLATIEVGPSLPSPTTPHTAAPRGGGTLAPKPPE